MRILHLLSSVDPRSGGPVEGVRQVGRYLNNAGHCVEAVSLDAPHEEFVRDFPLRLHALGPSYGKYRYNPRLVNWLRTHAHAYDAVIVNGLWQFHGFACWRALRNSGVPYFVFSHGMLDPWFKSRYPLKHLKKWFYWPWAEYRVIRDAAATIFTCQEEMLLARKSFWLYRCKEAVTTYGTACPPVDGERLKAQFFETHPSLSGKRILLYLGRIHEKKGCDILVAAFAAVAKANTNTHLIVAGPDPDGLGPELREVANQCGMGERISWPGMLRGDAKWAAFYACEAFILTSHQENFGIAVAEALACGRPVFISNKVNIWREVESDGAGFVDDDSLLGASRLVGKWLALSKTELSHLGETAKRTFQQRFTVDAMGGALLNIIRSAA
jgi:glycosyltransferase involved in cell wall biosynthesis